MATEATPCARRCAIPCPRQDECRRRLPRQIPRSRTLPCYRNLPASLHHLLFSKSCHEQPRRNLSPTPVPDQAYLSLTTSSYLLRMQILAWQSSRVERDAPVGYVRPLIEPYVQFSRIRLSVWKFVFIAPVPRTFSESFHFGRDGIVQLGQAVCGSPHHLRIAPFDSPFGQYISYPHVLCLPFSRRGPSLHGHCPASPLLRPHPTTAFAFANCSPPKFPCRTFGKCRPLCPAASTLPESSQQGDVGFTSTETLTTRKHLTRLYVGSSLALRPIPLSGKTPAHRSPFARLAVLIVCRFLYDLAPFS